MSFLGSGIEEFTVRPKELKLWILEDRRVRVALIEVFKIVGTFVTIVIVSVIFKVA